MKFSESKKLSPAQRDLLLASVLEFNKLRKAREQLATYMEDVAWALGHAATEGNGGFRVSARAKTLFSFFQKASRREPGDQRRLRYPEAHRQLTDLVGARLVLPSRVEADRAVSLVLDLGRAGAVVIDHINSFRREQRLKTDVFGYRAVHFVVAPSAPEILGVEAPCRAPWLLDGVAARHAEGQPVFWVEIQLRTELEDVYGCLSREHIYKRESAPPPDLLRLAARLAALLEQADEVVSEVRRSLGGLETMDLSSRPQELLREELELLTELVPLLDDGDERLEHATLTSRLQAALGDWKAVSATVKPHLAGDALTRQTAPLGAELARARARQGDLAGALDVIERVTRVDARNARVWCDLGDLYLSGLRLADALGAYREACRVSPRSVRARRSELVSQALHETELGSLSLNDPRLSEGILLGEEQARTGLGCPAVYFDLGLLYWARSVAILAAGPRWSHEDHARLFYRALDYTCRGVAESHAPGSIRAALGYVELLLHTVRQPHYASERLSMLRDVLELGLDSLAATGTKQKPAHRVRIIAGTTRKGDEERLGLVRRFRSLFLRFVRQARKAPVDTLAIIPGTGFGIDRPVMEAAIAERDPLDPEPYQKGKIVLRCYGARNVELAEAQLADFYERRDLQEEEFSLKVPILYWRHLLDAGYMPSDVRLLGVDGGWISRFEYMLCAALGGKAALVYFDHPRDWPASADTPGGGDSPDQVRAVYDTLQNEFWGQHENILPLPFDHTAIALWLEDPLPKRDFNALDEWLKAGALPEKETGPIHHAKATDDLARRVHEAYIHYKHTTLGGKGDDSTVPWEYLGSGFRSSNREAAAAWEWKQSFADFLAELKYAEYGETEEFFLTEPEQIREKHRPAFVPANAEKIRWISIVEHGRWCLENLIEGTRFGPRQNKPRKTRPMLVSWWQLSEEEKKLDWAQSLALWKATQDAVNTPPPGAVGTQEEKRDG